MKTNKKWLGMVSGLMMVLLVASFVAAVEVDNRTETEFPRDGTEDAINQGTYPSLEVITVKVDGDEVENGDDVRYEQKRDESISIRVKLMATGNMSDVEIIAMILGDDHYNIVDDSETFDVDEDVIYTKNLELKLPDVMDQDDYKLRILVADRYSASKIYNYNLKVESDKHTMQIKDVIFTPSKTVEAGRALLSIVRLRNLGMVDEDNVKVTLSIPGLGLSSSDYIDEIESDDSVSSEEMYMRLPDDAKKGSYDVFVSVKYDENTRLVESVYTINVEEGAKKSTSTPTENGGATGSEKTVIAIAFDSKDVAIGESGVLYPITLYNQGNAAKSYAISVSGVDAWGTATVSPANVVTIDGQKSETIYVFVTAEEEAAPGDKPFTVTITSDSDSKAINLNANVVKSSNGSSWGLFKNGLEVGLIVLLVLVVIIGLIVAFNKMKGNDEDGDQTYY